MQDGTIEVKQQKHCTLHYTAHKILYFSDVIEISVLCSGEAEWDN